MGQNVAVFVADIDIGDVQCGAGARDGCTRLIFVFTLGLASKLCLIVWL